MALIPKKSKNAMISLDSLGFETMIMLLMVLMFGSSFISEFVHVKFELLANIYIILLVVYLLLPNRQNYGKNGAQRVMICMKYYFRKIRRKVCR